MTEKREKRERKRGEPRHQLREKLIERKERGTETLRNETEVDRDAEKHSQKQVQSGTLQGPPP
jgi:hypothetical protein